MNFGMRCDAGVMCQCERVDSELWRLQVIF